MADNIKTIGATGADYATLQDFFADIDDGTNAAINTTAYGSGDVAIGEIIDLAFSVGAAFPELSGGGTVGLSKIVLRPSSANKHDGTFGSGCVVSLTTGTFTTITTNVNVTIEDLEISGTGVGTYSHSAMVWHKTPSTSTVIVQRCLFSSDGVSRTAGNQCVAVYCNCNNSTAITRVLNCLIRRFDSTPGSNFGSGLRLPYAGNVEIDNVTITGCYVGVEGAPFTPTCSVRNSLVMGSGSADFSNPSPWDTVTSLLTGDDSLGDPTTQNTTELFVDYAGGDFTPISGSDLIGAGTDLGTTPTGVNIDAKQRDRDAEGDTWDVGAIQTFSGGSAVPVILQQLLGK